MSKKQRTAREIACLAVDLRRLGAADRVGDGAGASLRRDAHFHALPRLVLQVVGEAASFPYRVAREAGFKAVKGWSASSTG